nr:aminotransferase class I/II-fold pyridoxal phosphate-dependent enzyme [Aminobacter niigataensis]
MTGTEEMAEPGSVGWFAEHLNDRTKRGIAVETSALIRAGSLTMGTKLPPVRDLAFALGVSPATISDAWSELRKQKIITGRGRNGSWVSGDHIAARPFRLAQSGDYGEHVLDLSKAGPDPALLPPLVEALRHGASAANLNSYERIRILPELRDAVQGSWPYRPEAFLATSGGYNAVYTVLHAFFVPGSHIAIEDPTALRLLDILEDLGARILPVKSDRDGPLPASLAAAMAHKPAAFLFQPRLHSVTCQTVSQQRIGELANVLEGSDTLIIEDDGIAAIATSPATSLGGVLPDQVIHIRSFSKTLGPDLRLAILSSSTKLVDQIQSFRSFGAGWTSRILQSAAAWLLNDADTLGSIDKARKVYRQRRTELSEALAKRGIPLPDGEGFCLWVPVQSEQFALITLAARGIAVQPGSKFLINPTHHIRVSTSTLENRYDEVADAITVAIGGAT